jgi:predicted site-specific integrase-resolvase
VIPALPQEDIFAVENEQRVAVYARVSTDDPRQTSSYELQKNHYHDVISKSPNWKLVQIYADEGISGTSLQHRDQFKLMIEDCKQGKIDLILGTPHFAELKKLFDKYEFPSLKRQTVP